MRTPTELTRPNSWSKWVAFAGLVETISAKCEVVAEPRHIADLDNRIISSSCNLKWSGRGSVCTCCRDARSLHAPARAGRLSRVCVGGEWRVACWQRAMHCKKKVGDDAYTMGGWSKAI